MQRSDETKARGWYLLLLIPFIAMLWVPSYNGIDPMFGGIPFFYWYQFLWVPISVTITALVYFMTREPEVIRKENPTSPINEELA